MAEENQVEQEVFVSEQCCDKCLDPEDCGNVLDILSEIKGENIYASCDCECEVAENRRNIREELHANPDIDTSLAELPEDVEEVDESAE